MVARRGPLRRRLRQRKPCRRAGDARGARIGPGAAAPSSVHGVVGRATRLRRLRCRRRLRSGPPRSIRRCRVATPRDAPRRRDATSRFADASLRAAATRSECGDSAPPRRCSGQGAASATGPRLASRVALPATAHLTHAPPRGHRSTGRMSPRSKPLAAPERGDAPCPMPQQGHRSRKSLNSLFSCGSRHARGGLQYASGRAAIPSVNAPLARAG